MAVFGCSSTRFPVVQVLISRNSFPFLRYTFLAFKRHFLHCPALTEKMILINPSPPLDYPRLVCVSLCSTHYLIQYANMDGKAHSSTKSSIALSKKDLITVMESG